MKKINVLTLCSGYDSQFLACKRLMEEYPDTIEFDLVGWSEIDPSAIKAHNLIFPEYSDRNFGDISKADWTTVATPIDLLTYSTPCQSISTAGKQEGLTEGSGTKSSLLWEVKRAITTLRPKFLLQENVKALVSEKFMPEFNKWRRWLEENNYANYFSVLNATDYGVPQNRERVFMVSIRKDPDDPCPYYEFPEPFPLEKRLKDVLEDNVDESYYLKGEQVDRIIAHCERKVAEGCGFKTNFRTEDEISGTIKTREGAREYDTYLKEPVDDTDDGVIPCAQRGRGEGWQQQIELTKDADSANCLTTRPTDSMVATPTVIEEPKINIVGNYRTNRPNPNFPESNRSHVYDEGG